MLLDIVDMDIVDMDIVDMDMGNIDMAVDMDIGHGEQGLCHLSYQIDLEFAFMMLVFFISAML